jgi:hypothetical protein
MYTCGTQAINLLSSGPIYSLSNPVSMACGMVLLERKRLLHVIDYRVGLIKKLETDGMNALAYNTTQVSGVLENFLLAEIARGRGIKRKAAACCYA